MRSSVLDADCICAESEEKVGKYSCVVLEERSKVGTYCEGRVMCFPFYCLYLGFTLLLTVIRCSIKRS